MILAPRATAGRRVPDCLATPAAPPPTRQAPTPPPAPIGLTLVAVDFSQEIKDLRTTMASVREVTDLSKLEATGFVPEYAGVALRRHLDATG